MLLNWQSNDTSPPCQSEKGSSKDSALWKTQPSALVSGGLPMKDAPETRSDINATGAGLSDAARSPSVGHQAILLYAS